MSEKIIHIFIYLYTHIHTCVYICKCILFRLKNKLFILYDVHDLDCCLQSHNVKLLFADTLWGFLPPFVLFLTLSCFLSLCGAYVMSLRNSAIISFHHYMSVCGANTLHFTQDQRVMRAKCSK